MIQEVKESLVGEDIESVSHLRIDNWKTMDLILHKHLHCIIETAGIWMCADLRLV